MAYCHRYLMLWYLICCGILMCSDGLYGVLAIVFCNTVHLFCSATHITLYFLSCSQLSSQPLLSSEEHTLISIFGTPSCLGPRKSEYVHTCKLYDQQKQSTQRQRNHNVYEVKVWSLPVVYINFA